MVLPRSRVAQTSLAIWEDAPLPELPELYCGIFLREGGNRPALEELADDIALVLRPQLEVTDGGTPLRRRARRRQRWRPLADLAPSVTSQRRRGSVQLTLRSASGGRNEASKMSSGLGLGLERVGERDLLDRLLQPRRRRPRRSHRLAPPA